MGLTVSQLKSYTKEVAERLFHIGSPSILLDLCARQKLVPNQLAMVGDRLYTDIEMAHKAGALGVLVLSGEATAADVAALSHEQANANLRIVGLRSGLQPLYSALITAGVVLLVWGGGQRVVTGAMTVGAFFAYLQLYLRFVGRGFRIPQLINSVQSGGAAYARLRPLLAPALPIRGEPAWASFRPPCCPAPL